MASNFENLKEEYSSSERSDFSDTDSSSESDSDSDSEPRRGRSRSRSRSHSPREEKPVCQYYNEGCCKKGSACPNLHICIYYLKGTCHRGASCHLNHSPRYTSNSSGDEGRGRRGRPKHKTRKRDSQSDEREPDGGRPYQWQIHSDHGWQDLAHDHIIESQYTKPNVKGIKIYNTRFGVISIDFNRMRVCKPASLSIRRLSSKQQHWTWYYCGNQGWVQYGKKDFKGKVTQVKSSHIEKEFQKNQKGCFSFHVDSTEYKIRFQEMRQQNLRTRFKRRVIRRPKVASLSSALQGLSVSSGSRKATWEFKSKVGKWHVFKRRTGTNTECSVSSADIEASFQMNPKGSMNFSVSGSIYKLNFAAMTQTNLASGVTRQVRRVVQ